MLFHRKLNSHIFGEIIKSRQRKNNNNNMNLSKFKTILVRTCRDASNIATRRKVPELPPAPRKLQVSGFGKFLLVI